MKITLKQFALGISSLGLLTIYGCGDGETASPVAQISVTAAVGAPLVGAVTATDSLGKATTSATRTNVPIQLEY